ncbi:hypothetical protein IQ266_11490 [filamentous cyanobacterium LEGE 11480]|uniref:Uncharacterized protein n=1 Tax=Romeriopsis navalis LEGE 11480 TaxID=2777977 RepID=A0A928VQQ0_9CYAN|nr:hypothetical protein [Romeriopsis navalis]MBE9030354.1 hypothetical protein [Romeriopsis navalis LEGE 11480]
MDTAEIRQLFALLLGFFATLIPGLAIFRVMPNATNLPITHWLMISTIGLIIGGGLYKPRRWWKSAIVWAMIGTGALMGLLLYIYVRALILPDIFLRIEWAIGLLMGAMPGMLLYKYWF